MPTKGVKTIDVVCPDFLSDCIKTFEENDMDAQNAFISNGSKGIRYIECLNDSSLWVHAMAGIIGNELAGRALHRARRMLREGGSKQLGAADRTMIYTIRNGETGY